MSKLLDPWEDAQAIAQQLRPPGAELLIALGAEAWCTKCQALRPAFEALCATQAPAQVTWLWLDLEDHAEFLGNFLPDDLPLTLRWRAGQFLQAAVLESIEAGPDGQLLTERIREVPKPQDLPDLWAVFAQGSWATQQAGA
jgi:hypothetical protein